MMHKKLLSLLVLFVLVASTVVGCSQGQSTPSLTIVSTGGGNVSVMKEGTASWEEAEVGMSLALGDIIKSGDNSSTEITFVDGSTIELQAGTEIEIISLNISTETDSSTIRLKQTIGSIIFRVTKIVDPASRYEVETPTGSVAVRGSAVQIYVVEDGTTWACNLEGDIWAIAQGVELQVPEGRCCVIRPSQSPELEAEVKFADPNLEAVIRGAIGKPGGPVYPSDLDGLTYLDVSASNITNLTGLEFATGMTRLHLEDNQISDISPLASLTNLTYLYLWNNQISDMSPVANLTNLTYLYLWNNAIDDISALANLTGLTVLNLGINQISDISALASLTNLTMLGLNSNQISDVSGLANLTRLTELGLNSNQISDISALTKLTNLRALGLEDNQISDIWPLAHLTNLAELGLGHNRISDISPLANLAKLNWLNLENNSISDMSPLANLTSLTQLYLNFNQISSISSLVNLTSLTRLGLAYNQVSDISPLVDNDGLSEGDQVYVQGNPLSPDSINSYIPRLEARGVAVIY